MGFEKVSYIVDLVKGISIQRMSSQTDSRSSRPARQPGRNPFCKNGYGLDYWFIVKLLILVHKISPKDELQISELVKTNN